MVRNCKTVNDSDRQKQKAKSKQQRHNEHSTKTKNESKTKNCMGSNAKFHFTLTHSLTHPLPFPKYCTVHNIKPKAKNQTPPKSKIMKSWNNPYPVQLSVLLVQFRRSRALVGVWGGGGQSCRSIPNSWYIFVWTVSGVMGRWCFYK